MVKIIFNDGECEIDGVKYVKEETEKSDVLITPNNIVFERDTGDGDRLGIVLNEKEQELHSDYGVYKVNEATSSCLVKGLKMVPVKAEDRKVDHTYFKSDDERPDFTVKSRYCKYLGNGEYVFIVNDKDVLVRKLSFKYWYEIRP